MAKKLKLLVSNKIGPDQWETANDFLDQYGEVAEFLGAEMRDALAHIDMDLGDIAPRADDTTADQVRKAHISSLKSLGRMLLSQMAMARERPEVMERLLPLIKATLGEITTLVEVHAKAKRAKSKLRAFVYIGGKFSVAQKRSSTWSAVESTSEDNLVEGGSMSALGVEEPQEDEPALAIGDDLETLEREMSAKLDVLS